MINNIYQSSDYLVCTEAGTDIWEEPKSGSSYQRYHSYNGMKTDDSYYYKVWQYSYLCINSCNIVIDGAENVTGMRLKLMNVWHRPDVCVLTII